MNTTRGADVERVVDVGRSGPVELANRLGIRVAASFEFFPPRSDEMHARLRETADRLRPFAPAFVSVTYGAGGSTRERTHDTVVELAQSGFTVAAHLTCAGASRGELREIAARYWGAGIRHLVALRGDLAPGQVQPRDGCSHASDLVAELRSVADFEVSVAAFPEGHPESEFSLDAEVENLRRKVAAGATRAMTQFFFENDVFLRYLDRVRAAGIEVPVVPGILPVSDVARTRSFATAVGAHVPDWLDALLEGLDGEPETRDLVAASLAAEQCASLATHGVRELHFYTLNRAALTGAVCRLLGLRAAREGA
jgi:methylenetetrahydrofolate reductase (NADPH)